IIERGRQFKAGDAPRVEPGHVAINMFFENSTRTMTSFQMAEHRLGMKILDFDPGHSSVTKGESLYDSVRTVDAIG
ncbi:aspartate carbamoyltransferase catalytic subunit, partial [Barnesiella sp. GGCC_0306]|nr:aspartate carbamoyltransferase catalytic subunit [Barnesiella sp. GGCC_0306]